MIIYGASGHGSVIADILKNTGEVLITFWDDRLLEYYKTYQVNHPKEIIPPDEKLIIGIGDNATRRRIANAYSPQDFGYAIHPTATIADTAAIGVGSVIMANAVINSDCTLGEHVIINTSASVDHDVVLESFVHISPNATLAGSVQVGEGTWIGAGSVIIQGVKIGAWVTVGAGAVVIKDIPDGVTVVGNPARIIS